MRMFALVAVVLSVPVSAQTVYSWEDADGVHYTDDLSQVPKKGRVDATLMKADPRPAVTPVAVQRAPALAAEPSRPASSLNEREWRDRFVAATRRISTLEQNITALQVALPARTECVAQPLVPVGTVQVGPQQGAPITTAPGAQVVTNNGYTTVNSGRVYSPAARCQLNLEHDRMVKEIELKRVELGDAKTDLVQLERQASYDNVPREWRRGW